MIQQYINELPPDEQFRMDDDDGTFFMEYEDWKDNFSTLFLNNDFPEDWTGVRFKSAWTVSNSGGIPKAYTPQLRENYAKNPQFLIQCKDDTEVVFSLTQTGGRLPKGGKYLNYPFSETLQYANVSVFEIQQGQYL